MQNESFPSLARRQFAQMAGAFGVLGLIEPQVAARALTGDKKRLSWLAYRNASAEGPWPLTKIEGKLPRDLTARFIAPRPDRKRITASRSSTCSTATLMSVATVSAK